MLVKAHVVALLSLALITASVPGHKTFGRQKRSDDQVVRIGVTLVQVDAVVTDKQGKLVTGLKPEDFEILVDGKSEAITNFSFISTPSAPRRPSPGPSPALP
jgi:hypothetical protein